jgi:hypothetical protein
VHINQLGARVACSAALLAVLTGRVLFWLAVLIVWAARNPNADPVVVQDMIRLPHGSGILISLIISALFWLAVLVLWAA